MSNKSIRPSRYQYRTARAVTKWYFDSYYNTRNDIGVASMFCRKDCVGAFAVNPEALAIGDSKALFKLLVTMTMFQRRSDLQIMKVLRGITKEDAFEMTDSAALLRLADSTNCSYAKKLEDLIKHCDLAKTTTDKSGYCSTLPDTACYMKRHTQLLKRYGHFGKMPTSVALTLRDSKVTSLAELKAIIWKEIGDPTKRATEIKSIISKAWRVSEKISSMFLSAVTNQALSGQLAPWHDGVDRSQFIVIDSNVDLFLKSINYTGAMTYNARRLFIQQLAERVPLDSYNSMQEKYNPRIVQQAFFMFMSESNRRANKADCSFSQKTSCLECPHEMLTICPYKKGTIDKKRAK